MFRGAQQDKEGAGTASLGGKQQVDFPVDASDTVPQQVPDTTQGERGAGW